MVEVKRDTLHLSSTWNNEPLMVTHSFYKYLSDICRAPAHLQVLPDVAVNTDMDPVLMEPTKGRQAINKPT